MFEQKTVIKNTGVELHFKDGSWGLIKTDLLCGQVVEVVMANNGQLIDKRNIRWAKAIPYCSDRDLTKMLSLDIETTAICEKYKDCDEDVKSVFSKWIRKRLKLEDGAKITAAKMQKYWKDNASFCPATVKIVCISIGAFTRNNESCKFYARSFFGENERKTIRGAVEYCNRLFNEKREKGGRQVPKKLGFVGHTLNAFDKSTVWRNAAKYYIELPEQFGTVEAKPWENKDFDLGNAFSGPGKWGFSLESQCVTFGIPTPKDNIDGSEVYDAWFGNHKKYGKSEVVRYCEKDILANTMAASVWYRIDPSVIEFISLTPEEELNNLK